MSGKRFDSVLLGGVTLAVGVLITWIVNGIFHEKSGYDQEFQGDHSGDGHTYVLILAAALWLLLCVPCCLLAGPLLIFSGLTGTRIAVIEQMDPMGMLKKIEMEEQAGSRRPHAADNFADPSKLV
jgi:hypothetical protein